MMREDVVELRNEISNLVREFRDTLRPVVEISILLALKVLNNFGNRYFNLNIYIIILLSVQKFRLEYGIGAQREYKRRKFRSACLGRLRCRHSLSPFHGGMRENIRMLVGIHAGESGQKAYGVYILGNE